MVVVPSSSPPLSPQFLPSQYSTYLHNLVINVTVPKLTQFVYVFLHLCQGGCYFGGKERCKRRKGEQTEDSRKFSFQSVILNQLLLMWHVVINYLLACPSIPSITLSASVTDQNLPWNFWQDSVCNVPYTDTVGLSGRFGWSLDVINFTATDPNKLVHKLLSNTNYFYFHAIHHWHQL